MSDADIFAKMDEEERIYAPQELPLDQQGRLVADEGAPNARLDENEPPAGGIIGNIGAGNNAMSSVPNIGHNYTGGAPGDPESDVRDPFAPEPERDR